MENTDNKIPDLENMIDDLKDYLNTNLELYKLKASEKGADMASGAIINIVLLVFASMAVMFVSIACALLISSWLDKPYSGFMIIGGFYAVIGVLILLFRDSWLKGTISDQIIKSIFRN